MIISRNDVFCEIQIKILRYNANALLIIDFKLCVIKKEIVICIIDKDFNQKLKRLINLKKIITLFI